MKKILVLIIAVIMISLVLIKVTPTKTSPNYQVTTSFYPLYFFTSEIVGDRMNVTNITPAGAEPHDYELTPSDIVTIQNSKLLILNGLVESWGNKVQDNLKGKSVKIVIAGENLENQKVEEDGKLIQDPHVWLSPKSAKTEMQNILKALISIDPTNADYYTQKEMNLEKELDNIDSDYKKGLATCETRTFVTSHAAFGYLATDYNLKQFAIGGVSPDEEPSLAKLAEISDLVKKTGIKYIFFESLVSPRYSETIAHETNAQTLVLDPIEGIQEQDLKKGASYLTIMQNNLQNLRKALVCK